MATPKAKRTLHNFEDNTMTYRFSNLVVIPETLNLEQFSSLYWSHPLVSVWLPAIRDQEVSLPIEFNQDGSFNAVKMKEKVQTKLTEFATSALLAMNSVQAFIQAKADEAAQAEIISVAQEDNIIINDIAEEVTL